METIYDNWEMFQQYINLLEHHLGTKSEIVLHDLKKDYGNTISDIRNGYLSGRKIGDPGGDWGIEVLAGTVKDGSRYNRIIHTRDGKIIRTSTVFFRGKDGTIIGSICINTDISDSVRCEEYLRGLNMYNPSEGEQIPETAIFADVNELLTKLMDQAVAMVGVDVEKMTKEEKESVLRYLDEKGAFLITKSSDRVCEFLGISKFKLYNYLNSIRGDKEPQRKREIEE